MQAGLWYASHAYAISFPHYQVEASVAHEKEVLQRVHQRHEAEGAPAQHEPETIDLRAKGNEAPPSVGLSDGLCANHLDIGRMQVPPFPVEEFGNVHAH